MNFAFSTRQKAKIALLLFCIMACTILIRVLEDKSLKSINGAFVSMYNDRLVPATDLFYISEMLFEKRDLLEKHNHFSSIPTEKILAIYNSKIDSALRKYGKTFLVIDEKSSLEHLKNKLLAHQQLELATVFDSKNNHLVFPNNLNSSYKEILKTLSLLTKTQSIIGKELVKENESLFAGSKIYSALQFALAILIGILIVSIMFASNVIKVKQERFNLN